MNIRLSGDSPEFAGFVFEVQGDRIVSRLSEASAATASSTVHVGLSTAMVTALAGSQPGPLNERGLGDGVDQTNHSIIVGDRWIVKHIARWGTADRSALIEQALGQAQSRDVPRFVGGVEWDHPSLGTGTIALVSEFIADASDGWTWAVNDVIDMDDQDDPEWPSRLGELVARVHADLAAAELPAGSAPQSFVASALRSAQSVAAELIARLATRDDATATRMRARIAEVVDSVSVIPTDWTPAAGVTHGDLHVGQVIRTSDDRYLLLDFDGDPQWQTGSDFPREPLERDLAHLMNSIDLVAAVAQKRQRRVNPSIWAWADRAHEQFLKAYRSNSPLPSFDSRVLPALRAEQLLFELRYAALYLPEWEYAPDGVISHRYPANATEEAPPWTPPDFSKT